MLSKTTKAYVTMFDKKMLKVKKLIRANLHKALINRVCDPVL